MRSSTTASLRLYNETIKKAEDQMPEKKKSGAAFCFFLTVSFSYCFSLCFNGSSMAKLVMEMPRTETSCSFTVR